MKEHYYGFNFRTIPKHVIPYIGNIENGDIIENSNKKCLYWDEHYNGWKLLTDDAYDYLEKDEINKYWRKVI